MDKKEIYTRQDSKVFEVINIGCFANAYVLREVKKEKVDKAERN